MKINNINYILFIFINSYILYKLYKKDWKKVLRNLTQLNYKMNNNYWKYVIDYEFIEIKQI